MIFGKDQTNSIVSMEDNKDGTMQIFQQDADGKIIETTVPNEYWILTDQHTDSHCKRLIGDGYYKHLNPFTLRDDFEQAKRHFRQYGDKAYFINDPKEAFMVRNGYSYYKGLKHSEVSVLSFDIETTTLEHNKDAKVLIISNTFRDSKGNKERKLFCYDEYMSDKDFFEAWCSWVREKDPSIIVGHNIFGFDFPYVDYCSRRAGVELILGRKSKNIRFNKYSSKFRKDQSQFLDYNKCYIHGREIIDTYFLSIKFDVVQKKYESYGLKPIIKAEGLEIEGRQFYDASLIRKNYTIPEEWEKIKDYALHDADDALSLWDLQGPSSFYMCNTIPKSLQELTCGATGSALNSVMVRNYLQQDHSLPKTTLVKKFEGGISIGVPGIYKHCARWDLVSMYPSIMRQYKVYDPKKDPKGIFLIITEYFALERLKNKKLYKETGNKYYDDLQSSQKILANSLYGACATGGLLFNYPAGAEFITAKGREILTKAIEWASGKKYEEWLESNVQL